MRLRSERIVTPAGTVAGELAITDGRIDAVSVEAPGGDDVLDVGCRWIVPGYIDLHVHGGGGGQCNTSDPDEIAAVARFHASHGTTGLLATTVSAPEAELTRALQAIARARAARPNGARVLGAHLEGPFISTRRPGAMDPATFLAPDRELLDRLMGTAEGLVRMATLAPELDGGLELIRALVRARAVASIGHSDATYAQTRAGVLAGARAATHAFNAMRPLHHREPGVLGAVLDLPGVSCELICDGIHADPAALRLAHRAKGPAGVRLVTDAMSAAGMPDGDYRLGSAAVSVREGRALLADGSSIAGSTLTMDVAVANAVAFLGITIEAAVGLAAANPARLIGLGERTGALAAGMDADLVVLDEDLRAWATMVQGAWVHGPFVGEGG